MISSGALKALCLLGKVLPLSARIRITNSQLAPLLRRGMNQLSGPDRFRVVKLPAPLTGFRMLLDWHTQKSYAFGIYPVQEARTMMAIVRPGQTAVDVGAHIGYFTLLLAKLVGEEGRVVAFEPVPAVATALKNNVLLNRLPNVDAHQAAVLDRKRTIWIESEDNDPLSMTGFARECESNDRGTGWQANAVSLDEFFPSSNPVHFVKIDVQGAEDLVLEGMARILSDWRPLLLVELHSIHKWGERHPALERLRSLNYEWRWLGEFPPEGTVNESHLLAWSVAI